MTSNIKLKLYASFVDINREYNLSDPECADDVTQMRKALWDMGYDVTKEDVADAYGNWCEECMCAGWIIRPVPWLQHVIDGGYLVPLKHGGT